MHGSRNQTSDWGRVLGLRDEGLIAIKSARVVSGGSGKRG